jgi:hypothetical protein
MNRHERKSDGFATCISAQLATFSLTNTSNIFIGFRRVDTIMRQY